MDKMNVKTIKNFLIIFIIGVVIGIGISYLLFSNQLRNDRITKDRIIAINQQLTTQLESANGTIASLNSEGQIKQRTIDQLNANQQRSEITIKQLTELAKQRQNIINQLTTGTTSNSKDLQRLREIIEGLPKRK